MSQQEEKAKLGEGKERTAGSNPDDRKTELSEVVARNSQRKTILETLAKTFSNPGFGVVFTASATLLTAVITASAALLTAVIANAMTTWQSLKIEEKKYEYSLLSEYLSNLPDNEEDLESVSKQLIFLIDIGAIGALNTEKIREYAENPETLPELYVFANPAAGYFLNIRSGPGIENPIVRRVRRGTPLEVTGVRRNGWVQLSDENWIAGNLVSADSPLGVEPVFSGNVMTVSAHPETSANIRSGPGVSFPVVGQYANDSRVLTTGRINNGWVELTNGNWISSENMVMPVDGDSE